jgi:winged helix DNA-binding protein
MDRRRALRQRLATQRLSAAPLPHAEDAVRLLACVQSQERDHAFFSLGLRSKDTTYAAVRAAYDRGAFLRTHILRPTWHFVLPEDVRWILGATSPRVIRAMAYRHAQVGLDDPAHVARSLDTLAELLRGRTFLTRREIGQAFAERGGLPSAGEQLGHLLLLAELEGLICSGPLKGVHHTYAVLDEVVPPAPPLAHDDALARLAHRFFAGHGPATLKDLARWASVTQADARAGVAATLAATPGALAEVEVDGVAHWFDPSLPRRTTARRAAYLLPVYDEAVLTYPAVNFPAAQGHPAGGAVDAFWEPVVVDETNAGMWRRTVGKEAVTVETRLATGLDHEQRALVRSAAQRLADFLERDLDYRDVGTVVPPAVGTDEEIRRAASG